MSRRRILFLMHFFHEDVVGGAEVQSYLLARELSSRGHDVRYLCDRVKSNKPRTEVKDGITVWRWFRMLPLFKILNLPIFLWAIIRFRPHAIYHRYASQYTFMGGVARLFGVRYVWNCCEDKNVEPRYFRNDLRRHFKTYSGNALKKSILYADAWLCDVLFSTGVRLASAVIAQNNAQQRAIRERFGKPSRIIRSGHPAHTGIAPIDGEDPTVLWLATYQPRKRPPLFLQAARGCLDLPAKFVLAGRTANEAYKTALVEEAQTLANVELRHVDSYEASWKEFERAYVYVCTSESEGFPNTFIQSWICGVPVVSLGVDPDNFITTHELGFLCRSVEEVTEKIRLLLTDPALRRKISEQTRRIASRHFDIRHVASDVESMLLPGVAPAIVDVDEMEAVEEEAR